jgi:antitoxin component YwqK of YwqJK toxin-antitoxin module
MRAFVTLLAFALIVGLGGCSKKSDNPTGPTTSAAPSFPTETFKGPKTSSSDYNVGIVNGYVELANAYSGYFNVFAGTNATQNGNTWTWSITSGNESVTFSMTKQSDGSYHWNWVVNGTDQSTGRVYNNKILFEGTISSDGKNGEWKVYQDTTSLLAADFVWTTNSSGTLSGTLNIYQDNGSTIDEQYLIKNNSDGSGEVDLYSGTVPVYKATWKADGSGTWFTYDSATGAQTGTGTWS